MAILASILTRAAAMTYDSIHCYYVFFVHLCAAQVDFKKKMRHNILLLSLLTFLSLSAQEREVIDMNFDWDFSRDSLFKDSRKIDVPHDFQIEQPWLKYPVDENNKPIENISHYATRGFKEMGTGWYLKSFVPDSCWKSRRVLLDFEGIMLVGDVYLNGEHVGGTDYGYVGFEVDITSKLRFNRENFIMVKANTNAEAYSRWYTGGGLFRPVSIVVTSKDLYFNRHPLYITTRDNRFVNIKAEVTNNGSNKNTKVRVRVYAPDGQLVAEKDTMQRRNFPTHTWEMQLPEMEIPNPLLWDTEHPYLYKVVASILRGDGSIADEVSETFGIRTIEFGPEFGLRLNGRKLLLKGDASHSSFGALGAAAYPRAIEKRIQLLKQFGINHIRTAHNPYSREFMRLCDRHGILVVDELYDKWTQKYAGGRVPWEHLWHYDLPEWVKRDRNSPSVILWSLGNELQYLSDLPFNDWGVTPYLMLREVLKRYDTTRLTTVAMHPGYRNWNTDSLPSDLALKTDIQSYNYRYMYFPGDGQRFPWMTFYQSEANTSNMGPNFYEMDLNKVIGLAYWGTIDYLGESQKWPAKGWAQGVFDISLQPKPKAYLMKSLFSEEPIVHIGIVEDSSPEYVQYGRSLSENWNRKEGSVVKIYTYTNAEEVELLINGQSQGKKENSMVPRVRNRVVWENVPYQEGRIEAIAYNKGKVVARHQLETTGEAVQLFAEADNSQWKADGMDLQHINIVAVDQKGRQVWVADDELTFEVEGPARLIAVSNGDITSDEPNVTSKRHLWNGHAMAILRAGREKGKVLLRVKSKYKTISIPFQLQ